MSHPLDAMIENAIREAQARGEFENLSGAGKPLDNPGNPSDAVMDRLMKESHAVPSVVLLQQDIAASRDRLKGLTTEEDRREELRKLSELQTRLSIELEAARKFS